MSNYDPTYIKAEQAYRAARMREQILGRREASRLRRRRRESRWISATGDN